MKNTMNQVVNLKKSDFKKMVISSSKKPKKQFRKAFAKEIDQFVQYIFDAFKYHKLTVSKWKSDDKRHFWVEKYLQNAIDNLLCSVNHLVSGYIVASGNLSRQYCESCAMAMIISNQKMKYYEKHFVKLNKKFEKLDKYGSNNIGNYETIIEEIRDEISKIQVNQSIQIVWNSRRNFEIDYKAWESFKGIRNYYHKFSHPSIDLLAKILGTSKGLGKVVFGSYYNPGYKLWYKQEIERKINLAKNLHNIIKGVNSQLINK